VLSSRPGKLQVAISFAELGLSGGLVWNTGSSGPLAVRWPSLVLSDFRVPGTRRFWVDRGGLLAG
jgi:hypothetical protein